MIFITRIELNGAILRGVGICGRAVAYTRTTLTDLKMTTLRQLTYLKIATLRQLTDLKIATLRKLKGLLYDN